MIPKMPTEIFHSKQESGLEGGAERIHKMDIL